ncbi:MAG: hypothetical protein K0A98_03880 [Trueperaceae bacterium]|nr:hypothetical protein [Trueperaceae bacterium]
MAREATTLRTAEHEPDVGRVERERVTDPVTGLPLMRYRFAGPPTLRPGMASPAGAWRVLRVDERDGRTTLDLEAAAGAEPLDRHPSAVDDAVVEAALTTLRLARSCGAVHGDLGPQRLWRRGAQVWIEGYGVRWRDDADAASDARDIAAGLLRLPGTRLSAEARARLAAIVDAGDVDAARPGTPAGAAAGPGTPAGAAAGPGTADAAAARSHATDDAASPRVVRGPPPGSLVRRGGIGVLALAARVAQQWLHRASQATVPLVGRVGRFAHRLRTPGPTPAAEDAADGTWAGLRPEVRLRLAIALVIASFTWVGLASWGQRAAPHGQPPGAATGHVVDVTVAPPGHPPVGLVVVTSPPGSSLAVGSVIASVPGKVWLDLDGRWSFEARFGERRSPTVDLILPFERDLRLAFPSPAAP